MSEVSQDQIITLIDMYFKPETRPYAIQLIKPHVSKKVGEVLESALDGAMTEAQAEVAAYLGSVYDKFLGGQAVKQNPTPDVRDVATNVVKRSLKGALFGVSELLFSKK